MITTATTTPTVSHVPSSRLYAWTVFALIFGLMLSDYQSRQVISALFPMLRTDWHLSDAQMGGLVSVVAMMVGLSTIPVSLLADRWGRVKSITLMAIVWCLATIACGLVGNFSQLFMARMVVGMGEAAYSSAGGALLAHVFPANKRATVFSAMLAGSLFGSVLGVVLGGAVAAHYGWRMAFIIAGAPGLLLAIAFPFIVRDYQTVRLSESGPRLSLRTVCTGLFGKRAAIWAYLGSGFQMLPTSVLIAWVPSYLNRYYGLPTDKAGVGAAGIILVSGLGMTMCGWLVDRAGTRNSINRARVPAVFALMSAVLLGSAFALPPGPLSIALMVLGAIVVGGHAGASSAIIIDTTHPGMRATALATLILANNLLGLAPGPLLVGSLSDLFDLHTALSVACLVSLLAAFCFWRCAHHYEADRQAIASSS